MRDASALAGFFVIAVMFTASVGTQDTLTLTYHGPTRDLVTPGRSFSPSGPADGVSDPTFRVCVSGTAKRIANVTLSASAGGTWIASGDNWILGVAVDSFAPLVNAATTGAVDLTANCFYVYAAEGTNPRWPVGSTATAQVTTDTGQTFTGSLAIPAKPDPIPVTPPQLPPQPIGDTDSDTVADADDQCPGTPVGDKVDTSGPWAGCTIDTTAPTVEIRRPTSSSIVRGYAAIMARAKDNIRVAGLLAYLVSWPGITAEHKTAYPNGVRIAVEGAGGGPDGTIAVPFWWPDGFYTVRVDAADWRGNVTTGQPLTFQVDNAPLSAPAPAPQNLTLPAGVTVLLPASAPAPAGFVRVADLGPLGILYAKQ